MQYKVGPHGLVSINIFVYFGFFTETYTKIKLPPRVYMMCILIAV